MLLLFSLPLMAGNIFQQMYTVVDTAVVGRVLGVDALAVLVAGGIGAEYIVIAGQNGVEDNAGNGGDGQGGEGNAGPADGEGQTAGEAQAAHQDDGGDRHRG